MSRTPWRWRKTCRASHNSAASFARDSWQARLRITISRSGTWKPSTAASGRGGAPANLQPHSICNNSYNQLMSSAVDELWSVARQQPQVDANALARAVEAACTEPLDYRTRLLIRDSISALRD